MTTPLKIVGFFVICHCRVDHKRLQIRVRTSVTPLSAPRVPSFSSYHILTSSVFYNCTDVRPRGIYLFSQRLILITYWFVLVSIGQYWSVFSIGYYMLVLVSIDGRKFNKAL